MMISLDMLLKILSIVSAAVGLIALALTAHRKKIKQEERIEHLESELHTEQKDTSAVRRSCREEQTLIIYGLLACLKGLKERGCNGPVTEAINKIEKHINIKAHEE